MAASPVVIDTDPGLDDALAICLACASPELDIKGIVTQGRRSGVEHFFVEQDMVADPEVALRRAADFLQKL